MGEVLQFGLMIEAGHPAGRQPKREGKRQRDTHTEAQYGDLIIAIDSLTLYQGYAETSIG